MTIDSSQSVYRERLLEHLLIGELLKHSWLKHGAELEVSQPAIDRAGHDVVLEANGVTRHVQLKASSLSARTAQQTVHLGLGQKPSGCVIWVRFDADTMEIKRFLFFGNPPGQPLPSLTGFKVAKHTKGDANGIKKERPNLRVVRSSAFKVVDTIPKLYTEMFGVPKRSKPAVK